MDNQKKAYGYALATVLLWSTVASAFKITLRYLSFLEMLFLASLTSAVAIFGILCIQGKLGFLRGMTRREWFHSAILGLLNPFAYYLILFKAYDLLPAQEAQPLNYTWPIMLVLLSALILRQRIRAVSAAAILLSFAGVLIVSTRGDLQGFRFTNPAGAALALSSSILWALFWLFNVKDPRDEALKLFLCFAFGTVYTFAALVLFAPLRCIPVPGLLGACYIGLFEMGITFVLWLKALTLSRSTAQVSNLIYLSPFVSLFFITMTVGEPILPSTVLGLSLIMAGVVLQQRFS
ncbi:MAG: EamA family transporter [Deltaproteobacteria bacterium HGW-Deltaproteobacteria-19]|nr:MAG: EamA family transporter [Deltaproteobacteria bacterium HGW-Deltaproteobacteria-19]